uniref:Uncharacterized protein n=1 Tax=Plectus sambesii TaxID=2011161 RepID=A0A914WEM2_9BILA
MSSVDKGAEPAPGEVELTRCPGSELGRERERERKRARERELTSPGALWIVCRRRKDARKRKRVLQQQQQQHKVALREDDAGIRCLLRRLDATEHAGVWLFRSVERARLPPKPTSA